MDAAVVSYIQAVQSLCRNMSPEALDFMELGLRVSTLDAKQFYIQANTIQQDIGFVYRGLLRSFYVDSTGKEITVNFVRENRYATHYSAFITRTPARYYFQCIEPSVMVNLSYHHIQEGYDRFPDIERYGRLIAEAVLQFQQKRIEGFLFDPAEKRYLDFIKDNPDLFNRVSLSHLSSYLGIERQTLTRIRQKLARSGF